MEDILGGLTETGTGDASMQFDFSFVLSLIWKIVLSILDQAGVFQELVAAGIDLSQYFNSETA